VRLRIPPLLREPDFRRFWSGHAISQFGDQITLLALPLTGVLILHAEAGEMGLLTAAALAPHLLLSLGVGAWVDRRRRRRPVMIAADVARALLLATIPLANAFDALTIWQLYAIAFGHGVFSVFFDVSYPTVFLSTIRREQLLDANGLLSQNRAISFVAGPSLAGLLVQLLTAPVTLLLDAVSFVGSAIFLGRVRAPEPETEPEDDARLRARLFEGLRFILKSTAYRASLLGVATINLFNFMFWALFILYATRELDVSAGTLGLVLGAGAFGGVLGAFVAAPFGRRIGVGPAFVLGAILFPAPLILVPLAGGPYALVLAMLFASEFLSGVGVMILDINANSINVSLTPDRIRARVTGSHRFVNYGVRPLGSLLGGGLGALLGLRPTLWIATVGACAGVVWLLPSPVPRMRELPIEAGEGVPAEVPGPAA
jgi:MFS family permease